MICIMTGPAIVGHLDVETDVWTDANLNKYTWQKVKPNGLTGYRQGYLRI